MNRHFFNISIWKTLYFNFLYFGWKGIHLPVLVSQNMVLKKCSGGVEVDSFRFANVRIGFDGTGICDSKYQRGIWYIDGRVHLGENARISAGVKFSCGSNGNIYLGRNVSINVNSQIICMNDIRINDDTIVSWDDLIMDSDFHLIMYKGSSRPISTPIYIGKNTWIGCRTSIFKGSHIADGCIIAANSAIRGKYTTSNCLLGTNGVMKDHIYWKR